jgi:hypothetical protein
MIQAPEKDRSRSVGYSLRDSEHELVKAEAEKRGVSASQLIRKSALWYIRTFPAGSPEPPIPGNH